MVDSCRWSSACLCVLWSYNKQWSNGITISYISFIHSAPRHTDLRQLQGSRDKKQHEPSRWVYRRVWLLRNRKASVYGKPPNMSWTFSSIPGAWDRKDGKWWNSCRPLRVRYELISFGHDSFIMCANPSLFIQILNSFGSFGSVLCSSWSSYLVNMCIVSNIGQYQ